MALPYAKPHEISPGLMYISLPLALQKIWREPDKSDTTLRAKSERASIHEWNPTLIWLAVCEIQAEHIV